MRIFVRLFLGAAFIALGFWLWTILFPSPDNLIRKRIAEVARLASFSAGEGLVKQGLRVKSLASCFGPQVEVAIDLPGNQHHELAGRDEIIQVALVASQSRRWLKVELLDLSVVLAPDQESSVVNLTLRVRFPEQKDIVVQEMKFSLQKIDREWLIIRMETVRTLSRAGSGRRFALYSGLNRNFNLSLNRPLQFHEEIKSKRKIKSKTACADGTV